MPRSVAGRFGRGLLGSRRPPVGSGSIFMPTILSAAISSNAMDSDFEAVDGTWGGTMVPSPSPSWP